MSVVIELSKDVEQQLRDRAAMAGQRPEDFARQLVESSLKTPTLEDDLARFRTAVIDSGESDEESATFIQSVVDQVREERSRSSK